MLIMTKDLSYELKDSHTIVQPKIKGMTYGKHTFAYYGTYFCNDLPINV